MSSSLGYVSVGFLFLAIGDDPKTTKSFGGMFVVFGVIGILVWTTITLHWRRQDQKQQAGQGTHGG